MLVRTHALLALLLEPEEISTHERVGKAKPDNWKWLREVDV